MIPHSARTLFFCASLAAGLGGCASPRHDAESGAETATEGLTVLGEQALRTDGGPISFQTQVKPVLESKCLPCHNGAAPAFVMNRGVVGRFVVPGKPEQSVFLNLTGAHHGVAVMPPVGNRLTSAEKAILWKWVAEGAAWPAGEAGHLHENAREMRETGM